MAPDSAEWSRVLTFGHKTTSEVEVLEGVLVDVDSAICVAHACLPETHQTIAATYGHIESAGSLRHIVRHGGDAVRIECLLAPSSRLVVRMAIAVREPAMDRRIELGDSLLEVALVSLICDAWREARVRALPSPVQLSEADGHCSAWCSTEYPMFAHQRRSIAWMRSFEAALPKPVRYADNVRVTSSWYVDVGRECFTTDPAWTHVHLSGGVCCDGTGMGKTATALRHIVESPRAPAHRDETHRLYTSDASLIVVPLNLVSQWQAEVVKFFRPEAMPRVIWLVQGKDLRGISMDDLVAADVVFTTFHFLRASKPYAEMIDSTVGSRSPAALAAWARVRGRAAPVVEAVTWNRVVVDELHATFESPRDLRHLRLLTTQVLWGLTATPDCDSDLAQSLYVFLTRERPHHPNCLAQVVAEAVRGSPEALAHPRPALRLVRLSADERRRFDDLAAVTTTTEQVVRLCTWVGDEQAVHPSDPSFLSRFMAPRHTERQFLLHSLRNHAVAVQMLQRSDRDATDRVRAVLARGDDELARVEMALADAERAAQARQLHHATAAHAALQADLARCESSIDLVNRQLAALQTGSETCSICLERVCSAITHCAHLFCAACIQKHMSLYPSCPTCRAPLNASNVTHVVASPATSHKLADIGALLRSLPDQPVILFVQWKALARGLRAHLRADVARLHVLEGNASQRAATLHQFASGGVLLLSLEEAFAGLHLPHVRHVVFAHAIVGDRHRVAHLERQAIARCVRHGQTGNVTVYSFVIAGCEEERLWRQTHAMEA